MPPSTRAWDIASSQSIALHRLTASDAGINGLFLSLEHDPHATSGNLGDSRLPKLRVLIWQMPVMLLNLSIVIILLGLIGQLFNSHTKTGKSVEVNSNIWSYCGVGLCLMFQQELIWHWRLLCYAGSYHSSCLASSHYQVTNKSLFAGKYSWCASK